MGECWGRGKNWDNSYYINFSWGFTGGSVVKNLPANIGNAGSVPGLGRSPKEEMATHSSILAWRIPWTEEPGGLQSMGLQRVRHDLATKQQLKLSEIKDVNTFP